MYSKGQASSDKGNSVDLEQSYQERLHAAGWTWVASLYIARKESSNEAGNRRCINGMETESDDCLNHVIS